MSTEKATLRELARKYAAIAADPVNDERRRLHLAVNDVHMIRPVVLINEVSWSEFGNEEGMTLRCVDPFLREAEQALRRIIYQWEHFPADMIVPDRFPVSKIFLGV